MKWFYNLKRKYRNIIPLIIFLILLLYANIRDMEVEMNSIEAIFSWILIISEVFFLIHAIKATRKEKLLQQKEREKEQEIIQLKLNAEKEIKRNEYMANVEMANKKIESEIRYLIKKYETLYITLVGNQNSEMQDNISFCEINDEVEIEYNYDNDKLLVSSSYDIGYLPKKYDNLLDIAYKAFIEDIDINDDDKYVISIVVILIDKPTLFFLPLYTKVVGVTFENRQEHLINSNTNDELIIKHAPTDEHPNSMIVLNKSINKVLGYLKSELSENLINEYGEICTFKGTILEITGGGEKQNYGCNICIDEAVEKLPNSN